MRTRPTILFFTPEACPVPALVRQWAAANAFPLLVFSQPEEVEAIVLRGHPCLLFVDGNGLVEGVDLVVRRLKLDAFTAIVPVTVLAGDHHAGAGPGVVRGRGGRGHHRCLLARRTARPARCDAGAHRAGRLGASLYPAAGYHRDRARDPAPARVGARSSRSATPTSTTSRNSTTATATTTAIGSSICCRGSCTTS